MSKIDVQDLSDVSETLLLPLYYRALESQRPDAILRANRSLIRNRLFPRLKRITQIRFSCSRQFDVYRAFLDAPPGHCQIGCGLDTRFDRLDNGQAQWVELDFPAVIALRRKLLDEGERHTFIASSALDFAWMDAVAGKEGAACLFLAEGVFPYLQPAEVRRLVLALRERFPGTELVFETVPPLLIRVQQLHPAMRNVKAHLGWSLGSVREMEAWSRAFACWTCSSLRSAERAWVGPPAALGAHRGVQDRATGSDSGFAP
jgi:O-methyltransferase involved in polyketide biosynthesis